MGDSQRLMVQIVTQRVLIGLALLVLFLAYSSLIPFSFQGSSVRLNAPDEMANYYFARQLAESGQIGVAVPLSQESGGHLHPRSATIIDGRLLPVGFLGLVVLYGGIAGILGVWVLPFITPFLAVMGAVAWYWLVRRVFGSSIAVVSAGLMLLHPAYWYNAARGFLPNVPFVSVLMIGLALWGVSKSRYAWVCWSLGGFMVGLALTIRLSEIPWVLGLLLALAVMMAKDFRTQWPRMILGLAGLIVPVISLLFLNNAVYHDPLVGGYQTGGVPALQQASIVAKHVIGTDLWSQVATGNLYQSLAQLVSTLLPFGINPEVLWANFLAYGVRFFMPWTICAAVGGLLVVRWMLGNDCKLMRSRSLCFGYITIALGVSVWLVLFYGSWVFYDNISKGVTLGASYIRYWLPIYIFATPFMAACLVGLLEWRDRGAVMRRLLTGLICLSVVLCSGLVTVLSPREGLLAVSQALTSYQEKSREIQRVTPSNAIIVSARSDKIFFPERTAATEFEPFHELPLLAGLASTQPLYYYGAWPSTDIEHINRRFFAQYHLALQSVASLGDAEVLYRVVLVP